MIGEGPHGSTTSGSSTKRLTTGLSSAAFAFMYPNGKHAGVVGVARLGGSDMKTWSVSAIITYSSVMLGGRFARSWVTACGRFMTGKPMSHVFAPLPRQPFPGSSCVAVTVGMSDASASSLPLGDERRRVNPVISVQGLARWSLRKWCTMMRVCHAWYVES